MSTRSDLRKRKPDTIAGMEIFEIQPVAVGGSPSDPSNKAILTREQHIDAVRYWNAIIRDLRNKAT
jgi:hypothetical protein